jgi:hypothetical protein
VESCRGTKPSQAAKCRTALNGQCSTMNHDRPRRSKTRASTSCAGYHWGHREDLGHLQAQRNRSR